MKGIIFNLLEEVIVRHHGEAVWEELLDRAGLSGVYTSLGSYPDAEIAALVGAASGTLAQPPEMILRWFGREAMPLLAERFPKFFAPYTETLAFVRSVNSIIHPEVRKLYAGAECPHFQFSDAHDGGLRLGYRSSRRLCGLAHGFIEGAAKLFGEHATIEHIACQNHGDERCVLEIHTKALENKIGDAA